jgi:hypothetical protein
MINHIRTLLLNENGSNKPGYAFSLEEYVPDDFKADTLVFGCKKIWNVLFGTSPDRAYKNWRLFQLSRLAESSDLLEYWSKFDSRLTHFNKPKVDRSLEYGRVQVNRAGDNHASIVYTVSERGLTVDNTLSEPNQVVDPEIIGVNLSGRPIADDTRGRCLSYWKLSLDMSNELEVTNINEPNIYESYILTFSSNLSQQINLHGSGIIVQFRPVAASSSWVLDAVAAPAMDLGTVLANLDILSDTDTDFIFSGAFPEYSVFKSYWKENKDSAERLSAITLALGYKIAETRGLI